MHVFLTKKKKKNRTEKNSVQVQHCFYLICVSQHCVAILQSNRDEDLIHLQIILVNFAFGSCEGVVSHCGAYMAHMQYASCHIIQHTPNMYITSTGKLSTNERSSNTAISSAEVKLKHEII